MRAEQHIVPTSDGWQLSLTRLGEGRSRSGAPVLLVPGYGMNSFIFRFHPNGPSFMESLYRAGFDPWSVDPRGTSTATRHRRSGRVSLETQAFVDLPAAFDYIAQTTGSEALHAIGCSLGGVLLYLYGALASDHRIDRLVTMGTPLRWQSRNPLLGAFGLLGPVIGRVPMRGTRRMARLALPVVSRTAPSLLSIYLNARITRVSEAGQLTRTVEDPHPRLNRELARWIRRGDLHVGRSTLFDHLGAFDRPLFLVSGSGDGICPLDAALPALDAVGGQAEHLHVEHPDGEPVGHADLFISDFAPEGVFTPIASWLG